MAATVISGKSGAVLNGATPIASVGNWNITLTSDAPTYHVSGLSGGQGAEIGNKDWSGRYEALGHTPALMPGDAFTFKGAVGAAEGVAGTAIIDEIQITIDVEAGEIIRHTVAFSGNGTLALTGGGGADTNVPAPATSIGTKVQWDTEDGDFTSPSELPNVRTVTITITSNNPSYWIHSATGQPGRVAGNISATVEISLYADDLDDSLIPQLDAMIQVRAFVNATEYWEFKWLLVQEDSDIGANINDGSLVELTITSIMAGAGGSTPAVGHIKNPAGTTWWPPA
jgi:hypothetical protein